MRLGRGKSEGLRNAKIPLSILESGTNKSLTNIFFKENFMQNLAVIEGRWFANENTSVKSIFDVLSDVCFKNNNHYKYEKFYNITAFQDLIMDLGGQQNLHYIYIAAHGSKNAIYAGNEAEISRAIIRNLLTGIANQHGSVLREVFFGSCDFINQDTINFFNENELGNLLLIAGYSTAIDWIPSTALDWCFWNNFLSNNGIPNQKITTTAQYLKYNMAGLCENLGFNIYRRVGLQGFLPIPIINTEQPL
jgi:hypothetical protein